MALEPLSHRPPRLSPSDAVEAGELLAGRIQLEPEWLPLHRLRGAREPRVEIVGPPGTLEILDASLRTMLHGEGITVAASTF